MEQDNKIPQSLFNLASNTYQGSVLSFKTKEMLGLIVAMVLPCNDYIKYHLAKCKELEASSEELFEVFVLANIAG